VQPALARLAYQEADRVLKEVHALCTGAQQNLRPVIASALESANKDQPYRLGVSCTIATQVPCSQASLDELADEAIARFLRTMDPDIRSRGIRRIDRVANALGKTAVSS
jgi:hypothetical protein